MSHASMILTVLVTMAFVIFLAPGVVRLTKGHALQYTALWLGIFFALTLFYQNFGPNSAHPLFKQPAAMSGMNKSEALKLPFMGDEGKPDEGQGDAAQDAMQGGEADDQVYVPPKEE